MSPEEKVRELYDALNSNDIPRALKYFDPQVLRIEFEGTPAGGSYRGFDEVNEHFVKGRETWAEGGCFPERLVVSGDKVAVIVHVRVRLKDKTDWLEGRVGDVFVFRNGLIVEFRTFGDSREALVFGGVV